MLEAAARFPRISAALCFGAASAATVHFAWRPDSRLSGHIALLTLGAGLAHAVPAAAIGGPLMDRSRTRTLPEACRLGAIVSLAASVLFSFSFALWVESSNAAQHGALAFLALVPMVALFSFLAAGWALLLVSIGVAWALFRLLPANGSRG